MANGSMHAIYIAPEENGQLPAEPVWTYYRHNSTTLSKALTTLESEEIRPDRQLMSIRMGTAQAAGEIVSEVSAKSFDPMLEAVMLGTWENNMLKVGAKRRSFQIVRRFADLEGAAPNNDKAQVFNGMEANTFNMTVSTSALINMTMGWVGRDMTLATDAPAEAIAVEPETTQQMDSFTGFIKEDGKNIAVITEISMALENGIEPRYVVGSRASIKPSLGMCAVSGTITAFFEDSYLLKKYINEESSSIEFEVRDPDGNAITFNIPNIKYTGGNTDVSGRGSVSISLPYRAQYSKASATTLSITRTYAGG